MEELMERREQALVFSTEPARIVDGGFLERLINGRPATQDGTVETPAVGVKEEADWFLVHADLPGIDPRQVAVTADHGVLTLAEGPAGRRDGAARNRFSRALPLPCGADPRGMLTIRQPASLDVVIPRLVPARSGENRVAT